jgi:RpiB/LacA/LacB family sugar-phosphate isomerase
MKTIIIGTDHAGFKLKEQLVVELKRLKFKVIDVSPRFIKGDDYPPVGMKVARRVVKAKGRGILICGSGVGMAIAANRIKGARAVVGHSATEIERARTHDDVNILALSGWKTTLAMALGMVKTFMKTNASVRPRHRRRVKQLG